MSTDQTTLHYASIGRAIAEQQAAEAAAKPPPMDTQTAQANRTQQLLYERHRREQQRMIEAAQQRQQQEKKEAQARRNQAIAQEADRNLAEMKAAARAQWTLPASDFEAAWRDYLYQDKVREQQARGEARLQRTPAYGAI